MICNAILKILYRHLNLWKTVSHNPVLTSCNFWKVLVFSTVFEVEIHLFEYELQGCTLLTVYLGYTLPKGK